MGMTYKEAEAKIKEEAGDRSLHPHKIFPAPKGLTSDQFLRVKDITTMANVEQLNAIISYLESERERRKIYEEVE